MVISAHLELVFSGYSVFGQCIAFIALYWSHALNVMACMY